MLIKTTVIDARACIYIQNIATRGGFVLAGKIFRKADWHCGRVTRHVKYGLGVGVKKYLIFWRKIDSFQIQG